MKLVVLLGRIASLGAKLGFDPLLRVGRETADRLRLRLGVFPLKVEIEGVMLRGLFRHRSFLISLANDYKSYTRSVFIEALEENTLVVDGGAHIGWYTCLAARRLPKGEVLAVEPDPF